MYRKHKIMQHISILSSLEIISKIYLGSWIHKVKKKSINLVIFTSFYVRTSFIRKIDIFHIYNKYFFFNAY